MIDVYGLANAGMAQWSYNSQPDPKDYIHLAPDPDNLPSAGFSIALNTVEVIEQDGCMFLCWGISSEVVGVFMSETIVDYGKKEASKIDPVSVYFGPIKNFSVSTNPNSLDATVGASFSFPWINFSARLVCFNLNRKSKNSCSECENYPSSYFKN